MATLAYDFSLAHNLDRMNAIDYYTTAINGLILFLMILKPDKKKSDWLLLTLLTILMVGNVADFLALPISLSFPLFSTLIFLCGPFAYLHIKSIIGNNKKWWPHLLLPIANTIICLIWIVDQPFFDSISALISLLVCFIFISLVYYSVLMIMLHQSISWYRVQVNLDETKWIKVSVICFVSFVTLSFISLFISDYIDQNKWAGLAESGVDAIIMSIFGFYAYSLGIIYPRKTANLKLDEADVEKRKRLFERLERIMKKEKPYLNSGVRIDELAEYLGVNKKYVSNAVNHTFGDSVTSYINHYRITLFKEKVKDHTNHHLTIEAIASECGFHSKSSFNRIFKAREGMTPSEYKKIQLRRQK